MAAATLSAVPTGTVDLVTTTTSRVHVPADLLRHRQHVLEVGRPVLVGRRPHRDEDHVGVGHRGRRRRW
jgi:hypothetical protein